MVVKDYHKLPCSCSTRDRNRLIVKRRDVGVIDRARLENLFSIHAISASGASSRSRHLPFAVTEGSLTKNFNEIGVR
jgi:hypothetical protein